MDHIKSNTATKSLTTRGRSTTNNLATLLTAVHKDHPAIELVQGDHFHWSPAKNRIMYTDVSHNDVPEVTLLHELAHALLHHSTFTTDYELLLMEVEAWEKALTLGKKYKVAITDEYVQNCLDTYRDWLYMRSTCPSCGSNSLQESSKTYRCFNCQTTWSVSSSRLCRPYRKSVTRN